MSLRHRRYRGLVTHLHSQFGTGTYETEVAEAIWKDGDSFSIKQTEMKPDIFFDYQIPLTYGEDSSS